MKISLDCPFNSANPGTCGGREGALTHFCPVCERVSRQQIPKREIENCPRYGPYSLAMADVSNYAELWKRDRWLCPECPETPCLGEREKASQDGL